MLTSKSVIEVALFTTTTLSQAEGREGTVLQGAVIPLQLVGTCRQMQVAASLTRVPTRSINSSRGSGGGMCPERVLMAGPGKPCSPAPPECLAAA